MSEKRNYSSIVLSPSSDSSAESLNSSEPRKKRWKENNRISKSEENIPLISSPRNGRKLLETKIAKTTMAAEDDDAISVDLSPDDAREEILDNSNSVSTNDQKQIRYDRQLRLWGDHGQALLESAHVCLLNATATGTEILKSLILPGVGSFTIIDGELISGSDAGTNFFLDNLAIGQSRAKVACELLKELNSDVRGDHVAMSAEKFIEQNGISAFDRFTVVVGTNLKQKLVSKLGEYLFNRGIPFLICQTHGLVGYVRLLIREHSIVESHPDNPLPNFMLDQPFPELVQFVEAIDLNSMDHKDHSHTPYLILLFKALEIWRRDKNDREAYPRTYKEKTELKTILKSMRQPDEKGSLDEENFQEAINSVNVALSATVVPCQIREILDDDAAKNLTKFSSNFWILCHALRRFVDENGRLPVRGTLPDMISDSNRYVRLQNLFLHKADQEASIVQSYVAQVSESISVLETRLFCKNSSHLRLIRSSVKSIVDDEEAMKKENFVNELRDETNFNALWYLVLRACDDFFDAHDRYPCSTAENNGTLENDKNELISLVEKKIEKIIGKEKIVNLNKTIEEVCRYGGSELHAIASFLGGVTAQEVIKLITYQYVPLNNTYIFNGNTGQASVFSL